MAKATLVVLLGLGTALIVLQLLNVMVMVFVALVIATTVHPLLATLQRIKIPKPLAVLIIYLLGFGVLAALFVLVIPVLITQGSELIQNLPQIYADLIASLQTNSNEFMRDLAQRLPNADQLATQIQTLSGAILTGAVGIGASVLGFLAQVVSIVVLSIYLTYNQSKLERFWVSLAPPKRRSEVLNVWRAMEAKLGGYVRSELLLMASVAVLASVGYAIMGLPYAIALGVLAGLLEFVPIVGPILGAVPALLVALSISPTATISVLVYSLVIQVLDNAFLIPRLMGKSVGVSPITVIVAVFAFSTLMGLTGAFLAIPLAAIIQVLVDHMVTSAGKKGNVNAVLSPDSATVRARIQLLRSEAQSRLRGGSKRIALVHGDADDLDFQADQLLSKAEQELSGADATALTDTEEVHSERLAAVEILIAQAAEMVAVAVKENKS